MELNKEEITTPPRPAATVVLLRDGDAGLEVLMIRRAAQSDVLGGAYVFPGGKLDAADSDIAVTQRIDALADDLHLALGEPNLDTTTAAALFVAAARETFEECGILMAHGVGQQGIELALQRAQEGRNFAQIIDELQLRIRTSGLVPWTRWITPRMAAVMTKRFDTRFFVAEVPEGATAQHDDHEATEAVWLQPRAALERYLNREIQLAPPQIQSLAHLARHTRAADVVAEAAKRLPPLIEPESFEEDGKRILVYPGDPKHSVPVRAMPGPTRLVHNKGLFLPEAGFEALFGQG